MKYESKMLIDELSKMPPTVIAIAYHYAINYTLYGEDVTEKWTTVIQNTSALEKAYRKGYYDALQRKAESEEYRIMNNECRTCDYWDSEYGTCGCPSMDKWYACPIEERKPENQQALREYAEQVKRVKNKTNGDVIMDMFPDCQPRIGTKMVDTDIAIFETEWWNAPYKTESKEMCNMTCKEMNEMAKAFYDGLIEGMQGGVE